MYVKGSLIGWIMYTCVFSGEFLVLHHYHDGNIKRFNTDLTYFDYFYQLVRLAIFVYTIKLHVCAFYSSYNVLYIILLAKK